MEDLAVAARDDDDEGSGGCGHRKCVFLLYYGEGLHKSDETSPLGFVLNSVYNADSTHMNAVFLPLLENSIVKCGCNLDLI